MDSFFGIGIFELFLIAVIALVVLGPERLPGAMRTLADYLRQIRSLSSEFTSQFSEEIKMLEELDPRRMVNDILDPAKTPSPAAKTPPAKAPPAKPAAISNVAKSTAAAAAVAKNSAKPSEANDNTILAPVETKQTAPGDPVEQSASEDSSPLPPDVASPPAAPDDAASAQVETSQ
ncbi:MAG: twin-arginine translocase subunit TatB [Caldilineaceae bacterium]|jgi:sec-independent protein translocase protein TatB|nr:twin-arginine translocase subunit TatB [Caldilineaceae bacterium]